MTSELLMLTLKSSAPIFWTGAKWCVTTRTAWLASSWNAPLEHVRKVLLAQSSSLRILAIDEQMTEKTGFEANLDVLILAAGLGTRMKSRLAKVLHKLGGRPIIAHVCGTAALLEPRRLYVIVGYQADDVRAAVEKELGNDQAGFVNQT